MKNAKNLEKLSDVYAQLLVVKKEAFSYGLKLSQYFEMFCALEKQVEEIEKLILKAVRAGKKSYTSGLSVAQINPDILQNQNLREIFSENYFAILASNGYNVSYSVDHYTVNIKWDKDSSDSCVKPVDPSKIKAMLENGINDLSVLEMPIHDIIYKIDNLDEYQPELSVEDEIVFIEDSIRRIRKYKEVVAEKYRSLCKKAGLDLDGKLIR